MNSSRTATLWSGAEAATPAWGIGGGGTGVRRSLVQPAAAIAIAAATRSAQGRSSRLMAIPDLPDTGFGSAPMELDRDANYRDMALSIAGNKWASLTAAHPD